MDFFRVHDVKKPTLKARVRGPATSLGVERQRSRLAAGIPRPGSKVQSAFASTFLGTVARADAF